MRLVGIGIRKTSSIVTFLVTNLIRHTPISCRSCSSLKRYKYYGSPKIRAQDNLSIADFAGFGLQGKHYRVDSPPYQGSEIRSPLNPQGSPSLFWLLRFRGFNIKPTVAAAFAVRSQFDKILTVTVVTVGSRLKFKKIHT